MKEELRKNTRCIIGTPSCNHVFSASKMCFIAYGFKDSPMEVGIVKNILKENDIEPFEAGSSLSSGNYAFCKKICSKIINSQFCIVFLNNSVEDGKEIPNANVNMEYGLMLGFGKHVLPFQKEKQTLPFNVSGLDTIKYSGENFQSKAEKAIKSIIEESSPIIKNENPIDNMVEGFLLEKGYLFSQLTTIDEKQMFDLGNAVGFNLLTDFRGNKVLYFGNFPLFSVEEACRKVCTMTRLLDKRSESIDDRLRFALISPVQAALAREVFKNISLSVLVANDENKKLLSDQLSGKTYNIPVEVVSRDDVEKVMGTIDNMI